MLHCRNAKNQAPTGGWAAPTQSEAVVATALARVQDTLVNRTNYVRELRKQKISSALINVIAALVLFGIGLLALVWIYG